MQTSKDVIKAAFTLESDTVNIIYNKKNYELKGDNTTLPEFIDPWEEPVIDSKEGDDQNSNINLEQYAEVADNSYSGQVLGQVSALLDSASPFAIIGILLLIVIIGALHSLEGGHNKIIIASMMVNNEIDFKGSIIYVFIFTLTHMSDIIILAIGLLLFDKHINIYEQLPFIQKYSAYGLVLISSYIVLKELYRIKNKSNTKEKYSFDTKNNCNSEVETLFKKDNYISTSGDNNSLCQDLKHKRKNTRNKIFRGTFKEQFGIAFISGLAPCLTGWTVFILIVSTGYLWLLLPATIAFGIGVFIVLIVFAYVVNLVKDKVFLRFDSLSHWAALASGILLLITSLCLVI